MKNLAGKSGFSLDLTIKHFGVFIDLDAIDLRIMSVLPLRNHIYYICISQRRNGMWIMD